MQTIIADFFKSACCSENDNDNDNETNKAEDEKPNSFQTIIQMLSKDRIINNSTATATASATTAAAATTKTATIPAVFRLPISYLPAEDRHVLSKPVVDDLELISAKDAGVTRSLYSRLTDANNASSSVYGRQFLHLWSETFTTNVAFLRATQSVIAKFRAELESSPSSSSNDIAAHTQIEAFWKTMKTNRVGFKDKFGYIDASPFPIIEQLNTMPNVLQVLSIYNVSTPLISLMMPVLLLIVPFFILKARGVDISVDRYTDVLKMLASTHAIGKLFTEFDSVSMEKKLYILMSVIFYFIQVYQNTMSCYRFYNNIYMIHDHLIMVRSYLETTANKMGRILRCCSSMQFYNAFGGCLSAEMQSVRAMCEEMADIEPFSLSMRSIGRIGHVMKYYYMFFNDADVDHMMQYSFGFNAYYEHLSGIVAHISSGALSACKFIDSSGSGSESGKEHHHTSMKGAYFFNTVSDRIVKNDIVLDKKLIITGPNAAGKTTIIKTTLFNIILSQQIGFGAYDSATIVPYHFLHCYLNIPDTSGRDSLFQAESRRCKEILDCITENSTKRHFCIFDELYSGTNPYEAVASAYGYVDCISGMRNVDFMLTTHYIQLCELFRGTGTSRTSSGKKRKVVHKKGNEVLAPNANIRNLHMETSAKDALGMDYVYHYKVVPGISKVRGGIKVLVDLKYPDSIIQTTKSVLDMKRC
jgi:ABC-type multidrug transport system fused ATPase/permease subunit